MRKKLLYAILLSASILSITGCQSDNNTKETTKTEAVTESQTTKTSEEKTPDSSAKSGSVSEVGGWKVTYEESMLDQKLENVSTQLGYTSVESSEYHKEASEGMKFCLLKVIFEKVDSKEVIDFTKLKLIDENGKEYSRMDDAFLSDLGMKRLQGTKLNFGTNEGWICYEVDESANKFTLEYPFEGETLSIPVE